MIRVTVLLIKISVIRWTSLIWDRNFGFRNCVMRTLQKILSPQIAISPHFLKVIWDLSQSFCRLSVPYIFLHVEILSLHEASCFPFRQQWSGNQALNWNCFFSINIRRFSTIYLEDFRSLRQCLCLIIFSFAEDEEKIYLLNGSSADRASYQRVAQNSLWSSLGHRH